MVARPPIDEEPRHFLSALIADGRPLLSFTGLALALSGGFALFLSATGAFLPHDVDYLGMTAHDLCGLNQCRIVHFMFHDRVSFGGVLIAIGTLYLWLAAFPLRRGEAWAWWTFLVSGLAGFSSFLCYLGYGYLDSWRGVGTLCLFPVFLLGMMRSRRGLTGETSVRSLATGAAPLDFRSRAGVGRILLLLTAAGQIGAGAVIMVIGMTTVFVPQDLSYLAMTTDALSAVNPRLIPLIAHDRAGFGGGLMCFGLTMFLIVWNARPALHLWQALALAGTVGFACAIGIHFGVGYLNLTHLAPAIAGAILFLAAIALSFPAMREVPRAPALS